MCRAAVSTRIAEPEGPHKQAPSVHRGRERGVAATVILHGVRRRSPGRAPRQRRHASEREAVDRDGRSRRRSKQGRPRPSGRAAVGDDVCPHPARRARSRRPRPSAAVPRRRLYIGLAVVFHGWEPAACEAVEPGGRRRGAAMSPPRTKSHGLVVTRIEALGFRSLRYVSQRLGPFHVLVGPNASGEVDVSRRAGLSRRPAPRGPRARDHGLRAFRHPRPRDRSPASDVDAARQDVRAGRGGGPFPMFFANACRTAQPACAATRSR